MSKRQDWYHSAVLLYLTTKLYKECVPILNSKTQFVDHYAIRTTKDNKSMRSVIKAELKNM